MRLFYYQKNKRTNKKQDEPKRIADARRRGGGIFRKLFVGDATQVGVLVVKRLSAEEVLVALRRCEDLGHAVEVEVPLEREGAVVSDVNVAAGLFLCFVLFKMGRFFGSLEKPTGKKEKEERNPATATCF